MTIGEITCLQTCNRMEQVEKITCYILEKAKCISPINAKSGNEIFTEYKNITKKHPQMADIPQNTFGVILSRLCQSGSCIKTKGKKSGYYLDTSTSSASNTKDSKLKENDLYPILEEWLESEATVIRNIANKRRGEKWQNVDILGWSLIRHLEDEFLELHSIEVKLSLDNWRLDLFEAVSHSMFANKSYFAFLLKESDKTDKDLKEYAYKFGIGLLAIVVDEDSWDDICSKKKTLDASDSGNCHIEEISIAPYHDVNLRIQNQFLINVLGIHSRSDLRTKL